MDNQVYTSALWEIRCTPVNYALSKYLNGDDKFNVMFSPDDALSVLQSGVLQMAMAIHLSIAFSNLIERLKWLYEYSDNFFKITLYLDFCWSRGRIRPRMKHPCYLFYFTWKQFRVVSEGKCCAPSCVLAPLESGLEWAGWPEAGSAHVVESGLSESAWPIEG